MLLSFFCDTPAPNEGYPGYHRATTAATQDIAAHGLDYDTDKVVHFPRPTIYSACPLACVSGGADAQGDLAAPAPREGSGRAMYTVFAREVTRTSPTSRSTSTVVVSSLLLCAEMKLSTFYSRVWDLFVWQAASKSILPRLLLGNGPGGAMYTRLPSACGRS